MQHSFSNFRHQMCCWLRKNKPREMFRKRRNFEPWPLDACPMALSFVSTKMHTSSRRASCVGSNWGKMWEYKPPQQLLKLIENIICNTFLSSWWWLCLSFPLWWRWSWCCAMLWCLGKKNWPVVFHVIIPGFLRTRKITHTQKRIIMHTVRCGEMFLRRSIVWSNSMHPMHLLVFTVYQLWQVFVVVLKWSSSSHAVSTQ